MVIEQLRLSRFRCFDDFEIRPDNRFNIITGLNGQGKTSLLEAAGLLAMLRSFRHARNREMVRHGHQESIVSGLVLNAGLRFQLATKLVWDRKHASINGKACKRASEYVGRISAVSFSPTDLDIIRGSPENRRTWTDKLAAIYEPTHVDVMARFSRVMEQRNRLLREAAEQQSTEPPAELQDWSEQLKDCGTRVVKNRVRALARTLDLIGEYWARISGEKSSLTIGYLSETTGDLPCGQEQGSSLEMIGQTFTNSLAASLRKELVLGMTLVGPHRDDLEIQMRGKSVRAFGSQGEVRSLVLAMRLAEADAYRRELGVDPILLIDDFSSELDGRRRDYLLGYLAESSSQVFLSTTEDLRRGNTVRLHGGKVLPAEAR